MAYFGSEDAYNKFVAEQEDYEQKRTADLPGLEKEISSLEDSMNKAYLNQILFDFYSSNDAISAVSADEMHRLQSEIIGFSKEHGSIKQMQSLLNQKKKFLDQARDVQEQERLSEQQAQWQQKYQGQSYGELQSALSTMNPSDAEYQWLSEYAKSAMRLEDYTDGILRNTAEVKYLEDALREIRGVSDQIGLGGEDPATVRKYKELTQKYGNPSELEGRIEELNAEIWKYQKAMEYGFLDENEDYGELSSKVSDQKTAGLGIGWGTNWWGQGDPVYDYINNIDGAREVHSALEGKTPYSVYDYMTEKEIGDYNYLYNAQGQEAAQGYLDYLEYTLDQRRMEQLQENTAAYADEHPVLSSALSVPTNLVSGMGVLDVAAQNAARKITGEYKPINYNSGGMVPTVVTSATRGAVSQKIADATGTISLDTYEHPVLSGILNGKSLGDVYQLGMSMVDSAAIAGLAAVGIPGGTALLGGSAASQGVLDALEAGANDSQALTMGILNGVFEALFEEVSLEKLLKGNTKGIIKSFLQQGAVEGSEEFFTTLANTVADTLVMAEKSDYRTKIAQYMSQGLDEKQATLKALEDIAIGMGWDFVGGMLTGGIMGAAAQPIQNYAYGTELKKAGITAGKLAEIGKTFSADTVAYKLAGKVDNNTGAYTIGRLFNEIGATLTEQNKADIASNLESKGMDADTAQKCADILGDVVEGRELSRKQMEILESNGAIAQSVQETVIEPSSSVYKRMGGYDDVLMELAKQKTSAENAPRAKQTLPGQENEAKSDNLPSKEKTASEAGQAFLKSDPDTSVEIKGFTESRNGKAVLELKDGQTADVEDVSFADEGDALVVEAITGMGIDSTAANELLDNYHKSGTDGALYANVIGLGYEYGYANLSIQSMLRNNYTGNISKEAINAAYSIGKKVRSSEDAKKAESNRKAKGASNVYYFNKEGKATKLRDADIGTKLAVSDKQKVGVQTAMFLQKIGVGGSYYFFESYVDNDGRRVFKDKNGRVKSAPNGFYYSNGDIYVDLNAGTDAEGLTLQTLSHELAHFIQQWDAGKYMVLADFLAEQYDKNGQDAYEAAKAKQQKLREQRGYAVPFSDAYHEFVADSMAEMFSDGELYEKLVKLKKRDKGIVEKLKGYFDGLAKKVRAVFGNEIAQTDEGKFLQEQSKETIEKLQQIFADALVGASENYQKAKGSSDASQEQVQYSDRDYTYEALTSKPDMAITTVSNHAPKNRADVVYYAKQNAAKIGKFNPKDGSVSVHVKDTDTDVVLSTNGLKHGLDRRFDVNAPVTLQAGEIVSNSIRVNELTPAKAEADSSYVLIGAAKAANGDLLVVQSVVNKFSSELESMDVLYAINAKKGNRLRSMRPGFQGPVTDSTISISELLDYVNQYFPDILPEDVLKHYGHDARPDGRLGESALYQDRPVEAISNRTLLANALESATQHEVEAQRLAEYKEKIAQIEEWEQKLKQLNAEIRDLSFSSGKRDNARLQQLRLEAAQTENRIYNYDKMLLKMEASLPIQRILEREKAKAYKRAKENSKNAVKTFRENQSKATERKKIRRKIQELDRLLNRGNKKQNVKEGMREFAAEALRTADVLFTDDYSNYDMLRNGVSLTLRSNEKVHFEEAQRLLKQIDNLPTDGYEAFQQRQEVEQGLRNKLTYHMSKLNEVFEAERRNLYSTPISLAIDKLAEAYKALDSSEYDYIKGAYQEGVYQYLLSRKEQFGGTIVKDMDLRQLERVNQLYTMVLSTVQTANSIFRNGKNEDLRARVSQVQDQIRQIASNEKDPHAVAAKIAGVIRKFSWNELRPVDAFERLGSDAFTELFWDAIDAQSKYGEYVTECSDVVAKARKENNYAKWDMKTATTFNTVDGKQLKLTLADCMSVYAYSKRENAHDHMTNGGFVFDTGRTYKEKGKSYVHKELSTPYRVSDMDVAAIVNSLTEEQRKYVDAIQKFLSEFGQHGNEVSRVLFGIDLFTEENYFPLMSAQDYLSTTEQELNNTQTMASLKNSGFTNQTVPHASNPIVLRAFDDVVLEHLDQMAKYSAYVLPIENLQRVFDSVGKDSAENYISTKALIGSVFGAEASEYFKNYITDLNGSHQATGAKNPLMDQFNKFKATAVSANLSVTVQQAISIIRSASEIDPKYFIPFFKKEASKSNGKLYDELMKYAPVAVIKEMGGFDVSTSSGLKDYIGMEGAAWDGAKVWKTAQDVFGWGAMEMDRVGWSAIWCAVKKEIASTTNLAPGSEAFLKACGKRFTEVVTKTQVYDSVNSRSGYMRSKSDALKYLTSFMGEPTVIAGMAYMSHLKLYRAVKSGDMTKAGAALKNHARVCGVLVASTIINGMVKAIPYAMRDDDEDEAFWERWAKHFGAAVSGEISPSGALGLLPVFRDVVSLIDGWTVERPDLALISDLIDASKKITEVMSDDEKREKMTAQGWYDLAKDYIGALGNCLNAPVRNIIRDVEGFARLYGDITDDIHPTDMKDAFARGVSGQEKPKTQSLYDSIMEDDSGRLEAIRSSYEDEDAYQAAIRRALREYDPRIKEAAQAYFSGDYIQYDKLLDVIEGEGKFSFRNIKSAIMSEVNALEEEAKEAAGETETAQEDQDESRFNAKNYYTALLNGDKASADLVYEELLQKELDAGYLQHEAESNIASALTTQVKNAYLDHEISREKALALIKEYAGKGEADVKKWDFEKEYGYSWGARDRGYRLGDISENDLIVAIMDIEGEDRASAKAYIKFLDMEMDHQDVEITAANAEKYFTDIQPRGISIDRYLDYVNREESYKSGKISAAKLKSLLMEIDRITEEEAEYQIEAYDWQKLGYETATAKNVEKYNTYCKPAGVSKDVYMQIVDFSNNTENDLDEEGNKIAYTAVQKIMQQINQLSIPNDQKTAIARSLWKESTVRKYKLW
ncbi:MAG: hypothetical protein ACI3V4_13010 [Faecousia sp.]